MFAGFDENDQVTAGMYVRIVSQYSQLFPSPVLQLVVCAPVRKGRRGRVSERGVAHVKSTRTV